MHFKYFKFLFAFNFFPTTFTLDGEQVWEERSNGQGFRDPQRHHFGVFRNKNIRLGANGEE